MDTELSHLEQYKMLREEIMQNIREQYRTEMAAAIGVGLLYGWLILHKSNVPSRVIWFIDPLIVLVCASRCLFLLVHNRFIAGYLMRIEETAFGDDTNLPGWERYLSQLNSQRGYRSYLASANTATLAVWTFGFCASIVISFLLSR